MGDEELRASMDEDPREPGRMEMHVRRFGGGSSENPRSSACHACSFGDTGARWLLPPFGVVGMVLSVEDERTLGDVFILRNIVGDNLADDALFMLVDDLDSVLVGVCGLTFISIGLKSSLEGFNGVVAPCLTNIEFWFRCVDVALVLGGVGGHALFCISRVFGLGICKHLAI